MELKKLQNGSDIRGVAMEGVTGEEVNLTREAAAAIGAAFLSWLSEREGKEPSELRIAIGRDSRLSGEEILGAVAEGICLSAGSDISRLASLARNDDIAVSKGMESEVEADNDEENLATGVERSSKGSCVLDCGLASTPAMFMACVFPETHCDGAIMITASHLPWNRNGMKFFTRKGGLDKGDITEILRRASGLVSVGIVPPSGHALARMRDAAVLSSAFADAPQSLRTGCAYGPETARTAANSIQDNKNTSNVIPSEVEGSPKGVRHKSSEKCDLMALYSAHLRKLIAEGIAAGSREISEKPLAGLKIVVDAGNGAGGFYAKEVLEPLGADISGSQFLEPDGRFPNHRPNPEDKEAMESISRAVVAAGADLGIIFDTDVDRSAAVDASGREIARNDIVALAAALIADEHPGTTVVTDSVTSDELTEFLEGGAAKEDDVVRLERGGSPSGMDGGIAHGIACCSETKKEKSHAPRGLGLKHLRYMRGYRNVINKAIELNEAGIDSELAIETSGHAAYKENFFLDDGAYLATKIVIKAALLKREGKGIESLIEGLGHPLEAKEFRLPIPKEHEDFKAFGNAELEKLKTWAENEAGVSVTIPNFEGVRLNFDKENGDGWALLRLSLHDPLMPLNIESRETGGVEKIKEKIACILEWARV